MALDPVHNRLLLGNYAQQILVYDLNSSPAPTFVHTLTGHTGSLRCMSYDPKQRLLFSSGFDGVSGVWSVADPKVGADHTPHPHHSTAHHSTAPHSTAPHNSYHVT